MGTLASLVVDLTLIASSFHSGLDAAEKQAESSGNNIAGKLAGIGKGIAVAGIAAVGAAVAGVTKYMGESIEAAEEAQKVDAQLEAVLKSTGGAAGVTAGMVNDLANGLANVTPFEDDAIKAGESMLLTFTGIGKDVFPQTTRAMLDMSQAMGQDMKSSAIQLGKALNDPTKGVSALTKVGVTFTDEQKKQIEAMQKAGDMAGAQTIILNELNKEFGGSAEAAGKTAAGAMEILKNKFGNLQETIGGAVLPMISQFAGMINDKVMPALEPMAGALAGAVAPLMAGDFQGAFLQIASGVDLAFGPNAAASLFAFKDNLVDFAGKVQTTIGPAATNLGSAFIDSLPMIQRFGADMLSFLQGAIAQVGAFLGPAVAGILNTAADIWRNHGDQIMAVINFAWRTIVATVGGAIILATGIIQVGMTLISGIMDAAEEIFKGNWSGAWTIIQTTAQSIWTIIQGALTAFMNLVLSIFGTNLTNVTQIVSEKFTQVKKTVTDTFNQIKQFLTDQINYWVEVGTNLVQGLWDGINNRFGSFIHDLRFKLQQAKELVTGIFEVNSPSRFFHWIGEMLMVGWGEGIDNKADVPMRAMANASRQVTNSTSTEFNITAQYPYRREADLQSDVKSLALVYGV